MPDLSEFITNWEATHPKPKTRFENMKEPIKGVLGDLASIGAAPVNVPLHMGGAILGTAGGALKAATEWIPGVGGYLSTFPSWMKSLGEYIGGSSPGSYLPNKALAAAFGGEPVKPEETAAGKAERVFMHAGEAILPHTLAISALNKAEEKRAKTPAHPILSSIGGFVQGLFTPAYLALKEMATAGPALQEAQDFEDIFKKTRANTKELLLATYQRLGVPRDQAETWADENTESVVGALRFAAAPGGERLVHAGLKKVAQSVLEKAVTTYPAPNQYRFAKVLEETDLGIQELIDSARKDATADAGAFPSPSRATTLEQDLASLGHKIETPRVEGREGALRMAAQILKTEQELADMRKPPLSEQVDEGKQAAIERRRADDLDATGETSSVQPRSDVWTPERRWAEAEHIRLKNLQLELKSLAQKRKEQLAAGQRNYLGNPEMEAGAIQELEKMAAQPVPEVDQLLAQAGDRNIAAVPPRTVVEPIPKMSSLEEAFKKAREEGRQIGAFEKQLDNNLKEAQRKEKVDALRAKIRAELQAQVKAELRREQEARQAAIELPDRLSIEAAMEEDSARKWQEILAEQPPKQEPNIAAEPVGPTMPELQVAIDRLPGEITGADIAVLEEWYAKLERTAEGLRRDVTNRPDLPARDVANLERELAIAEKRAKDARELLDYQQEQYANQELGEKYVGKREGGFEEIGSGERRSGRFSEPTTTKGSKPQTVLPGKSEVVGTEPRIPPLPEPPGLLHSTERLDEPEGGGRKPPEPPHSSLGPGDFIPPRGTRKMKGLHFDPNQPNKPPESAAPTILNRKLRDPVGKTVTGEDIPPGSGWKLHLATGDEFGPITEQLTTEPSSPSLAREISEFLTKEDIYHKVGKNSGQTGKDMTVYVGSKDDAQKVADALKEKFGDRLQPPHGDALADDIPFNDVVVGRFETTGFDRNMSQYGWKGKGLLKVEHTNNVWGGAKTDVLTEKYLRNKYGDFYTGTEPVVPTGPLLKETPKEKPAKPPLEPKGKTPPKLEDSFALELKPEPAKPKAKKRPGKIGLVPGKKLTEFRNATERTREAQRLVKAVEDASGQKLSLEEAFQYLPEEPPVAPVVKPPLSAAAQKLLGEKVPAKPGAKSSSVPSQAASIPPAQPPRPPRPPAAPAPGQPGDGESLREPRLKVPSTEAIKEQALTALTDLYQRSKSEPEKVLTQLIADAIESGTMEITDPLLIESGVTPEKLAAFVRDTYSKWGKQGQQMSVIVKALNALAEENPAVGQVVRSMGKYVRLLQPYEKFNRYMRGVADIWRASLISLVRTATRNVKGFGLVQLVRSFDETMANTFSQLTGQEFAGSVPKELGYRAVDLLKSLTPKGIKQLNTILDQFEQTSRVTGKTKNPFRAKLFGDITGDAMYSNRYIQLLTILNSLQEQVTRSAEFRVQLRAGMRKAGLDPVAMDQQIAAGETPDVPAHIVENAISKALEATFSAKPPKGTFADTALEFFHKNPAMYFAMPFPRFLYNGWRYTLDHSPVSFMRMLFRHGRAELDALSPASRESLLSKTLGIDVSGLPPARKAKLLNDNMETIIASLDQKKRTELFGKAMAGSALLLAAIAFRRSKYAGQKWGEYYDEKKKKYYDLKSMSPFSQQLFIAEFINTMGEAWEAQGRKPDKTTLVEEFSRRNNITPSDWTNFLLGITRTSESAKLLGNIITPGMIRNVDDIKEMLYKLGDDIIGGYTNPFEWHRDIRKIISDSEEEFPVPEALVSGLMEGKKARQHLPEFMQELIPGRKVEPMVNIYTGKPVKIEEPLLSAFGAGGKSKQPLQEQMDELGLPMEPFIPRTGVIEADRLLQRYMGEGLFVLAPLLLRSKAYNNPGEKDLEFKRTLLRKLLAVARKSAEDKLEKDHYQIYLKVRVKGLGTDEAALLGLKRE